MRHKKSSIILHICPPGSAIFVSHVIRFFEKINPNNNDYVMLLSDSAKPIKIKGVNFITKECIDNDYIKYIDEEYKVVIVHKFQINYINLVEKLRKPIKIWSAFGADVLAVLYHFPLDHLLLPNTKRQLCKAEFVYPMQTSVLGRFFLFPYKYFKLSRLRAAARSFDYIATVIPQEYGMLKGKVGNIGKYLRFNYSDFLFSDMGDPYIHGKNIQIGNAASYDNNHFDAFLLIECLKLRGRNVITPLSYGSPRYRELVIGQGYKLFGKSYMPIVDILPPNDYKELLLSCSHLIVEGVNQHALGNILISLWNGAKVFLNERNPIYSYLKSFGVAIFTTNHLQRNIDDINTVLSKKEMVHNRKIVLSEYGSEAIMHRASQMLIDIGYIQRK